MVQYYKVSSEDSSEQQLNNNNMVDNKVTLTILLPGSQMYSNKECEENKELLSNNSLELSYLKNSGKFVRETIHFSTRKSRPAKQVINLCNEAYEYMISKEAPWFVKPGLWVQLSKKARLEKHLENITQSLGGVNYTYNVLED